MAHHLSCGSSATTTTTQFGTNLLGALSINIKPVPQQRLHKESKRKYVENSEWRRVSGRKKDRFTVGQETSFRSAPIAEAGGSGTRCWHRQALRTEVVAFSRAAAKGGCLALVHLVKIIRHLGQSGWESIGWN